MNSNAIFELSTSSFSQSSNLPLTNFSDKKLLALCKKYGTQALLWRQKFIGLLPEANRRKLYEKKGYGSIFEFGKRMAGLSEDQIRLAINLEKRFEDKPVLRRALVEGRVSINKLSRIVSIANVSNESILAASAEVLSNRSLEVLVRDVKRGGESDLRNQNGLFEPQIDAKSLHVQASQINIQSQEIILKKAQLNLAEDTINHLLALQEKGIDIDKIVRGGFVKRNEDLAGKKVRNAEYVAKKEWKRKADGKRPVRYIGVETKKILEEEFGVKCAAPGCARESKNIHHTARFGLTGSNNPHFLAPLCKEHHDIAHVMDEKFMMMKNLEIGYYETDFGM
ncbi:MAG: HNH endonuclease signature motif containing protein [Candidatus Peregrinibacteria bacterium]|nr:HNH endonuclease signature motif containing protein [Candidatus Peregrinibacteria bacterium]MDZ4244444.1 HNH endonuclease signature motif containing protein [Candidatus Gracilibacteria bacterium]